MGVLAVVPHSSSLGVLFEYEQTDQSKKFSPEKNSQILNYKI
jgi:hypothetical protein